MALTIDATHNALRSSQRPLEALGHYRAMSFSGAAAVLSATDILASLWWNDPRFLVLTRLAINIEILTNVTVAPVFDAAAFVFRGGTAAASGTNSTTLSGTGDKQKMRKTMGSSILLSTGEIRTIGTTVKLTAVAGKTNDTAPLGAAFFGGLYNSSSTGTAVLETVGAAISPGWQDLYTPTLYGHPLTLTQGEGIEVQLITANNTAGTVKYGFLWEWAECTVL